jgi:hypothetical protein
MFCIAAKGRSSTTVRTGILTVAVVASVIKLPGTSKEKELAD